VGRLRAPEPGWIRIAPAGARAREAWARVRGAGSWIGRHRRPAAAGIGIAAFLAGLAWLGREPREIDTAVPAAAPLPELGIERPPSADDQARTLIGEGLYLESGMGEYREATDRYRQAAALPGVGPAVRAEVLFHLGEARERLGDLRAAADAYRGAAESRVPRSPWVEPARARLGRLLEAEASIRLLPALLDFERDLGGWQHSSHYAGKGTVQLAADPRPDRDGAKVLEWRTSVASREDDLIYLPLSPGDAVLRDVRFQIRTTAFPARLFLFVVHADGSRFSSPGFVVSPDSGWTWQSFQVPGDFRPIAGPARGPDPGRVKFLMLQDATGYFSTDRGENRILLDDFTLR